MNMKEQRMKNKPRKTHYAQSKPPQHRLRRKKYALSADPESEQAVDSVCVLLYHGLQTTRAYFFFAQGTKQWETLPIDTTIDN